MPTFLDINLTVRIEDTTRKNMQQTVKALQHNLFFHQFIGKKSQAFKLIDREGTQDQRLHQYQWLVFIERGC